MITVTPPLPVFLGKYLSDLETACNYVAALVKNADRQKLASRFTRLWDLIVEPEMDAAGIRQIAAAMERIIKSNPRPPDWLLFEARNVLNEIQTQS